MHCKFIVILLLICLTKVLYSQNVDEEFNKFIVKNDSLLRVALYKRDTVEYKKHLNELEKAVEKLNITENEKSEKYFSDPYYNFACIYSLLNDKHNALNYLERSKYYDYNHLIADSDLDNIRNEEKFKTFLKKAKAKSSVSEYLKTLKKAKKYNYYDNREINKYTYKSANDSDLVQIRTIFNLDSIAGHGNELLRIFNIMHWVHNTFLFDGTNEIPEFNGVLDLMNKCKYGKNTMFCAALAWVTDACYLSMGIISKQVVCLPKDSTDLDCHSINTVYSKTLDKWIWIDSANNAYIMNEKGELLSIAEVRERIINNQPLILNPEANVNNAFPTIKEQYLYQYMAKNLYAIQCFAEGDGDSKSNLLLPVEYKGVIPRTRSNNPKITNNPKVFWAKPE